jgi:hypothetical protein
MKKATPKPGVAFLKLVSTFPVYHIWALASGSINLKELSGIISKAS